MTLKEYIKEYYPIKEKLQIIKSDPIKMIMEQDDLPYDSIVSVDGKLQKVVYISEEDFIPVLECLSLMACSSVSMVSTLYKHKRQVRNIHSAQHFQKVSPEDRASKIILIFLCIFVISYSLSSLLLSLGPVPNIQCHGH